MTFSCHSCGEAADVVYYAYRSEVYDEPFPVGTGQGLWHCAGCYNTWRPFYPNLRWRVPTDANTIQMLEAADLTELELLHEAVGAAHIPMGSPELCRAILAARRRCLPATDSFVKARDLWVAQNLCAYPAEDYFAVREYFEAYTEPPPMPTPA